MTQEDFIYCPNCGLQQKLEGISCVRCGVNVLVYESPQIFPMACPQCGIVRQASFCLRCGRALITESQYHSSKRKDNLFRLGKWAGLGGVVILAGLLFFFFLSSSTSNRKASIGTSRGIERDEITEDALAGENDISPQETYQQESSPSAEAVNEPAASNDPEEQQASDWLNKFIPMLQSKGLITRIDDADAYTLFVSGEWAGISEENKHKIIENTSFAIKYFNKKSQLIIKDDATGDILAESGENGIIFYQ